MIVRCTNLPAAAGPDGRRRLETRRTLFDRRTAHKGSGASPTGPQRVMRMIKPPLTILLAGPRGFCAGVERAIQIVERTIERFGPPVYVRHEIVHNRFVVERL